MRRIVTAPRHTPGPWTATPFGTHGPSIVADGPTVVAWVRDMREIDPRHGYSTFEANAGILAAAPDMYSALQAIADMHQDEDTNLAQLVALMRAVANTAVLQAIPGHSKQVES